MFSGREIPALAISTLSSGNCARTLSARLANESGSLISSDIPTSPGREAVTSLSPPRNYDAVTAVMEGFSKRAADATGGAGDQGCIAN